MDRFDRAILEILQQDSTRPVADIAERIGLGTTACWRRIQKLEEQGVIRARVALLDPRELNVGVTVFVSVRTNQHAMDWLQRFHEAVGRCRIEVFGGLVESYDRSGRGESPGHEKAATLAASTASAR